MSRGWFILADDLTGAAECAAGFAERGWMAEVRRGPVPSRASAEVISYDADTRELGLAAAVARQTKVLEQALAPSMRLFKKIDSTLRGQPAAEIVAVLSHVRRCHGRAFAILAPAFPKMRRTTRHGHVYLDGRPLEESELWRREHTYENADLAAMLGAGVRVQKLSLELMRSGRERLKAELASLAEHRIDAAICDILTDDDLDRIAEASELLDASTVCVGSAGFAHALARRRAIRAFDPIRLGSTNAGTLIVVGSLARESRAAARALAAVPGVTYVGIESEWLVEGPKQRATLDIEQSLRAGNDVLLELLMREKPARAQAFTLLQGLARLLAPLRHHVGAIAATGGQTAAAVLDCFDVHGLQIVKEMEPGVVLGMTSGEVRVPMVTKAGAFGDETTLVRVAATLRRIKQTGSIE